MTIPPTAMEFEGELAKRLEGVRRLVVLGIGDELLPADRLGILAAREIQALRLKDVLVLLAGTTPESFTAPVRRFRPDRVLLLDAADLGARPGTVCLIAPGRVAGARLSTHALPLTVVMGYIEETAKAPAILVGIQPDLPAQGPSPTPAEQAGLTRFVAVLQRLLSERPRMGR